jgi:hypothetical protein
MTPVGDKPQHPSWQGLSLLALLRICFAAGDERYWNIRHTYLI